MTTPTDTLDIDTKTPQSSIATENERLVNKLYDGIVGVGIMISVTIVFGGWGFIGAYIILYLVEKQKGNHTISNRE